MRLVWLRRLFCLSKAHTEPVWHYPVTGYCPADGRYYAVRAKPKQFRRKHRLLPLLMAVAFCFSSFGNVAFQDMASLVPSVDVKGPRWTAFVAKAPVGSLHQAEMPFVDATTVTGSINTAGIEVPGIGRVALSSGRKTAKLGVDDPNPDENRINRADKTSRLVSVKPKAPARAFSAGSMFEKISMISHPQEKTDTVMAFTKSEIEGKEIQIAMAFHAIRKPTLKPDLPVQLAKLVNNPQPDVLALGYAPVAPDYGKTSPFEAILVPEADAGRFVPPIREDDHDWAAIPLPPGAFSEKQQKCLAEAVYYEARGESVKGQVAVAQVVLNRVRNPAYPNTICETVYQNRHMRNACQFSFACDGQKHRITEPAQWRLAKQVAKTVTAGLIWLPDVGSSTHYHATYVRPFWAPTMKKVAKIGLHIFYRTKGGGWS